MYLFTRNRTAKASRLKDAMAWAIETRDFVNKKTSFDVSLHAVAFGRPVGSFTWATFVDGRAQLADVLGQLMADPKYLTLAEKGGELFEDSGEDSFRQILTMQGMEEGADPPAFSQAWTSVIAPGQFDHATEWALDMGAYAHDLTGHPTATLADAYGEFGALTWIATFDEAAEVDTAAELLSGDAEWVKRLNYAEDLFLPGSGRVWLNRRID